MEEEDRSRPIRVKAFGSKLNDLRGKRSAEAVTRQMLGMGVSLTPSTLYQYEGGTVEAPDAGVLWALARIYGVSLEGLIEALVYNRTHRDIETLEHPIIVAPMAVAEDERSLLRHFRALPEPERAMLQEILRLRFKAYQPQGEELEIIVGLALPGTPQALTARPASESTETNRIERRVGKADRRAR